MGLNLVFPMLSHMQLVTSLSSLLVGKTIAQS